MNGSRLKIDKFDDTECHWMGCIWNKIKKKNRYNLCGECSN